MIHDFRANTIGMAGVPNCNPTKLKILALLATYFCLRTHDAAFLLRGRDVSESDERSVRRTLSILYGDGFLERLPHLPLDRDRGGVSHVYGLSRKGVAHAFKCGYATQATKTLTEHSLRTLDHELEITSFHIALHGLTANRGLRYTWRQTDLKHTVHPDAHFTIAPAKASELPRQYFLEIERAKFANYRDGEPQIIRKLGAFYEYYNSDACEAEWGFRHFRVIIVQRTDARREGLLEALRGKYEHRMFWLTTEPACRVDLGGDIFKTPRDATQRSYSLLMKSQAKS